MEVYLTNLQSQPLAEFRKRTFLLNIIHFNVNTHRSGRMDVFLINVSDQSRPCALVKEIYSTLHGLAGTTYAHNCP